MASSTGRANLPAFNAVFPPDICCRAAALVRKMFRSIEGVVLMRSSAVRIQASLGNSVREGISGLVSHPSTRDSLKLLSDVIIRLYEGGDLGIFRKKVGFSMLYCICMCTTSSPIHVEEDRTDKIHKNHILMKKGYLQKTLF